MTTSRPAPQLDLIFDPEGDTSIILTTDAILNERRLIAQRRAEKEEHELTEHDRIPLETLVPGGDVRYRVSSAILKNTSPVFRLFFKKDGLHDRLLSQVGSVEFVDEDVNPQAFSYFLDMIYHNYENIPGFGNDIHLDFDTWVEAMVILDKYDLHQAAYLYKRAWWQIFSGQLPVSMSQYSQWQKDNLHQDFDLRAWISVCYVMQKPRELDLLLGIYKLHSTGFADADFDLPLPARLEMADRQRLAAFDAVNRLLRDYHESAVQWSTQAVCKCNKLQLSRQCDREVLEKLTKAFKTYGWLHSPKRTRNGANQSPAIQIDPSRVTFNQLHIRIPKMKNFPHHCYEAMDKEIADKAMKWTKIERQKQANAADPFMGDSRAFDQNLEHPQQMFQPYSQYFVSPQPTFSSSQGYRYEYPFTSPQAPLRPPYQPRPPPPTTLQLPSRKRSKLSALPAQNSSSIQRLDPGASLSAHFAQIPRPPIPQGAGPSLPRPPQVMPGSSNIMHHYTQPTQSQFSQMQILNQLRAQSHLNSSQMWFGYTGLTNSYPISLNQILTATPATTDRANDLFNFDFDTGLPVGDDALGFLDSGVDVSDDFGMFGSTESIGNGSGKTPASPINLDVDEDDLDETDMNQPVDIIPCNPSPFHTVIQKIFEIGKELTMPVPIFRPSEPVENVEITENVEIFEID